PCLDVLPPFYAEGSSKLCPGPCVCYWNPFFKGDPYNSVTTISDVTIDPACADRGYPPDSNVHLTFEGDVNASFNTGTANGFGPFGFQSHAWSVACVDGEPEDHDDGIQGIGNVTWGWTGSYDGDDYPIMYQEATAGTFEGEDLVIYYGVG